MYTIGLKVLKNKLSEYIRLAAAGETVIVTDRGRAVAQIGPAQPKPRLSPFEEKGIREGWLRPARDPNAPLPPNKPLVPIDQLMHELDEDREDR